MKKGFVGVARVYGLVGENDEVFYVGCTVKGLQHRLDAHLYEAKKNDCWMNTEKNHIIRSLDYEVTIKELASKPVKGKNAYVAQRKAANLERMWIRRFIDAGFKLCNRVHGDTDYTKGNKQRIKKSIAA